MSQGKYRMIAIDLDGTLLSPDGIVTDRTRAAVRRALSAGLLVCFATGRNWTESKGVLDGLTGGSGVFVGGAMVMDTGKQVTLHRTMMHPELAASVCQVLEDLGHAVLALQDTTEAGVDYLITDAVELNPATRDWMAAFHIALRRVPGLGRYHHRHTVRVGICAANDEIAAVQAIVQGKFGRRILCQSLHVPAAHCQVLEAFDPAVNKWSGVLHVAKQHGVKPERIIAIGDDINDLPMMRNAGLGVAMGNARPEVRAAAKRVIGANSEDGLAQFLEELIAEHAVQPLGGDHGAAA